MTARAAVRVGLGSYRECRAIGEGHLEEGSGERWAGAGCVEWEHSHDIAVGSSDHPGRADEGTTAEVEAVLVLGSGSEVEGELRFCLGMKHLGSCPTPRVHVPAGTPARARSRGPRPPH